MRKKLGVIAVFGCIPSSIELKMVSSFAAASWQRASVWPSISWRTGASSTRDAFCSWDLYGCGEAVPAAENTIAARTVKGVPDITFA